VLAGIGASFALGFALAESGAADLLAGYIGGIAKGDPFWALVVLYVATVIVTELITNNAAGVLMFPIAMAVAQDGGVSYLPYVICVMVGASAGFITPIGYQTNLMSTARRLPLERLHSLRHAAQHHRGHRDGADRAAVWPF